MLRQISSGLGSVLCGGVGAAMVHHNTVQRSDSFGIGIGIAFLIGAALFFVVAARK
jgi:hypothetical protein